MLTIHSDMDRCVREPDFRRGSSECTLSRTTAVCVVATTISLCIDIIPCFESWRGGITLARNDSRSGLAIKGSGRRPALSRFPSTHTSPSFRTSVGACMILLYVCGVTLYSICQLNLQTYDFQDCIFHLRSVLAFVFELERIWQYCDHKGNNS